MRDNNFSTAWTQRINSYRPESQALPTLRALRTLWLPTYSLAFSVRFFYNPLS
jgi:hypothetical protein